MGKQPTKKGNKTCLQRQELSSKRSLWIGGHQTTEPALPQLFPLVNKLKDWDIGIFCSRTHGLVDSLTAIFQLRFFFLIIAVAPLLDAPKQPHGQVPAEELSKRKQRLATLLSIVSLVAGENKAETDQRDSFRLLWHMTDGMSLIGMFPNVVRRVSGCCSTQRMTPSWCFQASCEQPW
jgi:hypothetical protein